MNPRKQGAVKNPLEIQLPRQKVTKQSGATLNLIIKEQKRVNQRLCCGSSFEELVGILIDGSLNTGVPKIGTRKFFFSF
jgi:hypothetical protein